MEDQTHVGCDVDVGVRCGEWSQLDPVRLREVVQHELGQDLDDLCGRGREGGVSRNKT